MKNVWRNKDSLRSFLDPLGHKVQRCTEKPGDRWICTGGITVRERTELKCKRDGWEESTWTGGLQTGEGNRSVFSIILLLFCQ